jgi:hypothetical protein
MGLQPTGSKTDLLLNCQYPFADDVEVNDPPGEPARYGSAFHELMAGVLGHWANAPMADIPRYPQSALDKLAVKWGLPPSSMAPLPEHVMASAQVLIKWLEGENPWHVNFTPEASDPIIEKAFIIKPAFVSAAFPGQGAKINSVRETDLPSEDTHHYEGLRKGEIALTVDLTLGPLTLDHKTGHQEFSSPKDLGQLRTAALVRDSNYIAVLDADRRGIPAVYGEKISAAEREAHAKALRKALLRINDGSLRPGPWCARCPAREDCPTQNNDLLVRASALVPTANAVIGAYTQRDLNTATAAEVARLHLLLAEFNRLEKPTKEDIRQWIRAHPEEEAIRPDGKRLQFVKRKWNSLSQSSIVRAYGKEKGEKVLAKLRKDGAIESGEREELWALNDKV